MARKGADVETVSSGRPAMDILTQDVGAEGVTATDADGNRRAVMGPSVLVGTAVRPEDAAKNAAAPQPRRFLILVRSKFNDPYTPGQTILKKNQVVSEAHHDVAAMRRAGIPMRELDVEEAAPDPFLDLPEDED